jgi:hypothetical protein
MAEPTEMQVNVEQFKRDYKEQLDQIVYNAIEFGYFKGYTAAKAEKRSGDK